jgi:hypothetical protein
MDTFELRRRMVPVPGFLVKLLAEHLLATQSVFVFPAPRGDHLYYQSWRRRFWNPAVEASGPRTAHTTLAETHCRRFDD